MDANAVYCDNMFSSLEQAKVEVGTSLQRIVDNHEHLQLETPALLVSCIEDFLRQLPYYASVPGVLVSQYGVSLMWYDYDQELVTAMYFPRDRFRPRPALCSFGFFGDAEPMFEFPVKNNDDLRVAVHTCTMAGNSGAEQ